MRTWIIGFGVMFAIGFIIRIYYITDFLFLHWLSGYLMGASVGGLAARVILRKYIDYANGKKELPGNTRINRR